MNIEQPLPKQAISGYFKGILHYCLLFCCSLLFMPLSFVEAKTKKTAVKSSQKQQKNSIKEKKKESTKGKKPTSDIIAYTSLCLEYPRKLAKYATFYHQGAHCIGLDINRIDITSPEGIMCSIYSGRRLEGFAKEGQKATWKLVQRYYEAQSLADLDYNVYQNYKKSQGNNANYTNGILTGLLTSAIVDAIQAAKFEEQNAIFDRMLPYMMGLCSIKQQVKSSKINVVMLSTTEPLLWEPATF